MVEIAPLHLPPVTIDAAVHSGNVRSRTSQLQRLADDTIAGGWVSANRGLLVVILVLAAALFH